MPRLRRDRRRAARFGAASTLSTVLYHDISAATPIMIAMPAMLTRSARECRRRIRPSRSARQRPGTRRGRRSPANAGRTGWPAADQRDFSAGQSRGMKCTVTAASARKCAKRRTSRLVLSIGYIHSPSQCGIRNASAREMPGHRDPKREHEIGDRDPQRDRRARARATAAARRRARTRRRTRTAIARRTD